MSLENYEWQNAVLTPPETEDTVAGRWKCILKMSKVEEPVAA